MMNFRVLFLAAAVMNLGIAVVGGIFPLAFFSALATEPPDFPVAWPLLAVVIGLFGGLYAYAACRPERADVAIAVGLASKVVGPIGWMVAVATGHMQVSLFGFVLIGDLIWWFPLLSYLLRDSRYRFTAMAWTSTGLHLAACLGLLACASGTEMETSLAARQQWILQHPALWSATWTVWALSSMSLLALCTAWIYKLVEVIYFNRCIAIGIVLMGIGVIFDLAGETTLIAGATRTDAAAAEFEETFRFYQWMSPVIANGLYCVGGLLISIMSCLAGWWRVADRLGIVMWSVGLGLSAFAILEYERGMVISGAAVMITFLVWSTLLGWRMRPASTAVAGDAIK